MNPAILIGAFLGLAFYGWRGALIGGAIGYFLSQFLRGSVQRVVGAASDAQAQFIESTFAVMGAVSKADGKVTHEEIGLAETLFAQFRMSPATRDTAKAAFARGKAADFDLDAEVARFARASRGQRVLHQMFIQVQLSALAADGRVHAAEHAMLLRIGRGLGLSEVEISQLESMLRGGPAGAGRGGVSSSQKLDEAYRVLGVPASVSNADLKKAYRRLMSQNHPDKLAGQGLPESMRAMAEQRTREITGAYEIVEKARAAA
jgi:DnaJ like chaperone protein